MYNIFFETSTIIHRHIHNNTTCVKIICLLFIIVVIWKAYLFFVANKATIASKIYSHKTANEFYATGILFLIIIIIHYLLVFVRKNYLIDLNNFVDLNVFSLSG